MHQPRAGRRASQAAPTSAFFDPLEGPQSAAASNGKPSWLDVEEVGTVESAPPVPRVATTVSDVTEEPLFKPPPLANAGGGVSWLDDADEIVPPPAAAAVASPPSSMLTAAVQSTRSATPQSDHVTSPAFTSSKPPSAALPSPKVSYDRQQSISSAVTSPSLGASTPQVAVTSAPVSARPIVAYDDDATLMATLEKELAEVQRDLETRQDSLSQLEKGTHDLSNGFAALEAQAEFVKRQLTTAKEASDALRLNFSERTTNLKERQNVRLMAATTELRAALQAESSKQQNDLKEIVAAAQSSITSLQTQLDDAMKSMEVAPTTDAFAISKLTAQLKVFIADERSRMKARARDVLGEESRFVITDASKERAELLDHDRMTRMKSLQEHRDFRNKKFEMFRRQAKDERQASADRLFGVLKVTMERYAAESQKRSAVSLQNHREKVRDDETRARTEIDQQAERIMARSTGELRSFDQSSARAEADLIERLESATRHTSRVYEAELQSAERLLRSATGQLSQESADPLNLLHAMDGVSLSNDQRVEATRARVDRVLAATNEALSMVKPSRSGNQAMQSEVHRLIEEREAIVLELRSHMDKQRDALRLEWLRLESTLSSFESKVTMFEKDLRQHRVQLSSSQAKLESTRAAWESEARSCLSDALMDKGFNNNGLPVCAESLLASVLFSISCKLRDMLKGTESVKGLRRTFVQQLAQGEELITKKQDEVSKATLKIIDSFEQLAEHSAKVEMKQQWLEREEEALFAARDSVKLQETEFNNAVVNAREVAERLRALSVIPQKEDYHAGDGRRGQRRYPSAAQQQYQQHAGRGLPSTAEMKYRHLYDDSMQQYDVSRFTGASGRNSANEFQSLVPLDSTRYSQAGGLAAEGSMNRSGGGVGGYDLSLRSHRNVGDLVASAPAAAQQAGPYATESSSSSSNRDRLQQKEGRLVVPPSSSSSSSGNHPERRFGSVESAGSQSSQTNRRSLPTPSSDSIPGN